MAIEAGTKLGHYEVVSSLGAGGMGEVYRAKDTKLGREVAIKVLLDEVSADPERLARFEREARVLASLNHNSIATLFGFEKHQDTSFLVMEVVEGETLADRISEGPIPIEEALPLFLQIAEGLEAAHEKGVIHRDLKPANIKVSPDGSIKILDFGLAKAMAPEAAEAAEAAEASLSMSPTLSMQATQHGVILGTPAYMSPEQAGGETSDKRADIWAFGVVLYEMLTGRPLFTGKNASHIMAAVINTDPDWTNLPANLHPRIRMLLERCLQKDTADRYHDIGDARVDVRAVLADPSGPRTTPSAKRPHGVPTLVLAASVVAAMALGWLGATRLAHPIDTRPWVDGLVHFTFGPPEGTLFDASFDQPFELSPDGSALAFIAIDPTGTRGLWIRDLQSETMRRLDGTEGARSPFWSPDGEEIGYYTPDALRRVRAAGGEPVTITTIRPVGGNHAAWAPDDTILYWPGRFEAPLQRISALGGTPSVVGSFEWTGKAYYPVVIDDGDWFGMSDQILGIHLNALDGSASQVVGDVPFKGRLGYSPGNLFYVLDGVLVVHGFDEDKKTLIGNPRRLVDEIPVSGQGRTPYSVSRNGVLAYQRNAPGFDIALVWVDRFGDRIEDAVAEPRRYRAFGLSPDGNRLAYSLEGDDGSTDVWVRDLVRGGEDPWTANGDTWNMSWSRDGTAMLFTAGPSLAIVSENQNATLVRNASQSPVLYFGHDLGSDGDLILYSIQHQDASLDLALYSIETDVEEILPVSTQEWSEWGGNVSPDRNWLAYTTDRSGTAEVYVARFPSGEDPERISITGGREPEWNGDGDELFFVSSANELMAAPINLTVSPVRTSDPVVLFGLGRNVGVFGGDTFDDTRINAYAAAPDGRRFLVPVIADTTQPPIHVVINWPALLDE